MIFDSTVITVVMSLRHDNFTINIFTAFYAANFSLDCILTL